MTWKHFTIDEFECSCGCGTNKIKPEFVTLLDELRERAGCTFVINSGYRCPTFDITLGGKGNHTTGYAADIAVQNSFIRHLILNACYEMGVKRIGVGQGFIHIDTLDNKPSPRTWTYK